jgi:hypothetical protein
MCIEACPAEAAKMKWFLLMAVSVCAVFGHDENWPVREQQVIEKTLPLEGDPMRLVVDNLFGYVHVRATSGSKVHVVAHKTVRAETESDIAKSREVSLDISGEPGTVSVMYNAPWRCRGEGHCNDRGRRFYEVHYDIDVEVPRGARTAVSTVLAGDVTLEGGTGDFDAGNVNGAIHMSGISGSGKAHTVNGPIEIYFARNPAGPCRFQTVNGPLDAYFPQQLSADLAFKTMNGQIYSDFDVNARPIPAEVTERHGSKYIYHGNRANGGRAGKGGPELSFDTLNGDIRLHRGQ